MFFIADLDLALAQSLHDQEVAQLATPDGRGGLSDEGTRFATNLEPLVGVVW